MHNYAAGPLPRLRLVGAAPPGEAFGFASAFAFGSALRLGSAALARFSLVSDSRALGNKSHSRAFKLNKFQSRGILKGFIYQGLELCGIEKLESAESGLEGRMKPYGDCVQSMCLDGLV